MDGFDTSFFFAFKEGHPDALHLYREVMEQHRRAAVSTVTVFELLRHGFVGRLNRAFADEVAEEVGTAFVRAGVGADEVLRRAAAISHGMGLAMADSMIAASLESAGCDRLHTTDSDFSAYEGSLKIAWLD